MPNRIAITTTDNLELAQQLSAQLKLPIVNLDSKIHDLFLNVTATRIELVKPHENQHPLFIDFTDRDNKRRFKTVTRANSLLAQACGLRKNFDYTIVDATAGLGQDAYELAQFSKQVVMLERNPILFVMLDAALAKLKNIYPDCNLHLKSIDAKQYLNSLQERSDVIYLDPMFPERKKSASVKKPMQTLQQLIGPDDDGDALFELALQKAVHRVVVKRPKLAPALGDKKPSLVVSGKSFRFDVYLIDLKASP